MNFSLPKAEKELRRLIFLKYAGGASMTQSFNDQGHMHHLIHQIFRNASFIALDVVIQPPGPAWEALRMDLRVVESGRRREVWKAMCYVPQVLDKACTISNVQDALHLSGVVDRELLLEVQRGIRLSPSNVLTIVNKCPQFLKLSEAEANVVIANIPTLPSYVANGGGRVHETEYDRIFDLYPGIDNVKERNGMQLNDLCVIRQRATIISAEVPQPLYASLGLATGQCVGAVMTLADYAITQTRTQLDSGCKLVQVGGIVRKLSGAWGMKQDYDSKCTSFLNQLLTPLFLNLRASGIMDSSFKASLALQNDLVCPVDPVRSTSLGPNDLKGIFYIYGFVLVITLSLHYLQLILTPELENLSAKYIESKGPAGSNENVDLIELQGTDKIDEFESLDNSGLLTAKTEDEEELVQEEVEEDEFIADHDTRDIIANNASKNSKPLHRTEVHNLDSLSTKSTGGINDFVDYVNPFLLFGGALNTQTDTKA